MDKVFLELWPDLDIYVEIQNLSSRSASSFKA